MQCAERLEPFPPNSICSERSRKQGKGPWQEIEAALPPPRQNNDLQRDDGGRGHPAQKSQEEIDRELDKSLEDSFPSSDPPAISQPTKTEPAGDPKIKP